MHYLHINSSLESQPNFVYDSTGKITGYKTKAGADTVFPFSVSDNIDIIYLGAQTTIILENDYDNVAVVCNANSTSFKQITVNGEAILYSKQKISSTGRYWTIFLCGKLTKGNTIQSNAPCVILGTD